MYYIQVVFRFACESTLCVAISSNGDDDDENNGDNDVRFLSTC